MIIICYKESKSDYLHIRTTQSTEKEINTSKLYLGKAAFSSEKQGVPPNDFDIAMTIRRKWEGGYQSVPVLATFDRETSTYWIYSLTCSSYIPYESPSTEENSGFLTSISVYANSGKTLLFQRKAEDQNIWTGSHFADGEKTLIDEHAPIIIKSDRTISENNVVLIAGDRCSQQVTFEIDEQYDGISFLSEVTDIYLNYVPVNFEQGDFPQPYVSEKIQLKNIKRKEPDLPTIQFMVTIPYLLTSKPGQVPFNIAVVSAGYYWQTRDSVFTVLNSRFSPQTSGEDDPVVPVISDPLAQLADQLNALREGRDTIFAQHVGEYLAIDSAENSEGQDITEIIFDANEDEGEV